MITSKRLMLASILAAASTLAMAQTPATPAPASEPAATAPAARSDANWRQKHHGDRQAKRMERLKTKLNISAAQEDAWNRFTTAMQPPAQAQRAQHPHRKELAKLTTPQRLDRMQALQAERQQRMSQRVDAIKAFYAQLTPEQQKIFDERGQRGPGKRGMKSGHGHGHGHGMMRRS